MKVSKKSLISWICLFGLCEPLGLYTTAIHPLFSIAKLLALAYSVLLIIHRDVEIDAFLCAVLAFCTFMLIPTVINNGNWRDWFRFFYMYMSVCIIVKHEIHRNSLALINNVTTIISIVLLANLISLLSFGPDMAAEGVYGGGGTVYTIGIRTRITDWMACGIPLAYVSTIMRKRNKNRLIFVIFSTLIFVVINSVSAGVICFFALIGTLIVLLRKQNDRLTNNMMLAGYFGAAIISFLIIGVNIQDKVSWLIEDVLGEALTLNNRTNIWRIVLLQIPEHLYVGHGWGVAKAFTYSKTEYVTRTATATHNQFLSLLYDGGIIGILLFTIIIVIAAKKLRKCNEYKIKSIMTAGFIAYCVLMIPEIGCDNTEFFMFLAIIAYSKDLSSSTGSWNTTLRSEYIENG